MEEHERDKVEQNALQVSSKAPLPVPSRTCGAAFCGTARCVGISLFLIGLIFAGRARRVADDSR